MSETERWARAMSLKLVISGAMSSKRALARLREATDGKGKRRVAHAAGLPGRG